MIELCLHIYHPKHTHALLKTFASIFSRIDRVLVSTPVPAVADITQRLSHIRMLPPYRIIGVENERNDWSGYLPLLKQVRSDTFIIGNDSIVNRRIIRKRDVETLLELTTGWERPCLVGELDTARASVPIDGRSSSTWVSSYLFGMKLKDTKAEHIAEWLETHSNTISDHTQEVFMAFIVKSRPNLLANDAAIRGKLSAMYLERLLTEYATAESFDIVSQYGGNWNRKIRKLIEVKFL